MRGADRILSAEIQERRRAQDLEQRSDVLSMLVQATHTDGRPMSDAEIRDELLTLVLAGYETTAATLAWAVERIVRHSEVLDRLVEEACRDGHEYVDAVIKETLRLRPVLPLVARRLTEPTEVGGVLLPAGVSVVPSIYLMHRRPDVYPEPELFRPERFLHEPPGTHTWIPFGGGVRRCVGAAFAQQEIRIVLSTLFGRCTVRPAREVSEPMRTPFTTQVPGHGAEVILGPRVSSHEKIV
jgi:cytochrome P450